MSEDPNGIAELPKSRRLFSPEWRTRLLCYISITALVFVVLAVWKRIEYGHQKAAIEEMERNGVEAVTGLTKPYAWWDGVFGDSLFDHVTKVTVNDPDFSDLASLRLDRFSNLRSLDLTDTNVSDLAPLEGMTQLRSLDLGGTPVTDLTPLIELELDGIYLSYEYEVQVPPRLADAVNELAPR